METARIDCVVVGYNDVNFQTFAESQKKMAQYSGAYHEVTTNSVLLNGRRITYMDLINQGMEKATGVNPEWNAFAAPSLGVCYLQSFLCKRGYQVETVNFFNHQKERFRALLADKPRAVAITTTYYVDNQPVSELVQFVREHAPETKIIAGGPHIYNLFSDYDAATLEYVYRTLGADIYIIDSQGELSLANVLAQLRDGGSLSGIANLAYFDDDGEFHLNGREVENNAMDANSTEWQYIDKELITPLAYMRTARSCPFSCAFCNYPTLAGQHVLTGLERLEEELRYLYEAGTRYLVFVDDTFNVPLPRFKKLLQIMIANKWKFQWISFFRCSNADQEAFDLMAASGCIGVFLGIESGDQTVLNHMAKFADVNRYKWGIRQLHDRGIMTFASLICGFPGETRQTMSNTLQFVEETSPTFFNVQLYYHDTRAPIARKAEEFQIDGAGYNWRHKTMNWRTAADLSRHAFRSVKNSTPLSLYGFSIWSLPYLMGKGLGLDQIIEFGDVAREMLVKSFDDMPVDFTPQVSRLAQVFQRHGSARTQMQTA
jgi:radical SAM PhpK family P-methyltransferase